MRANSEPFKKVITLETLLQNSDKLQPRSCVIPKQNSEKTVCWKHCKAIDLPLLSIIDSSLLQSK